MSGTASWSDNDITTLLDFLLSKKATAGDDMSFQVKAVIWSEAVGVVNNVPGLKGALKSIVSCRKKFAKLKEKFLIVAAIKSQSGFKWDDEKGADIGPENEAVWKEYVKTHSRSAPFRNKGWPWYDKMLPLMPTAPSGSNIYRPLSVTQASAADEPDKSHETHPQTLSGRSPSLPPEDRTALKSLEDINYDSEKSSSSEIPSKVSIAIGVKRKRSALNESTSRIKCQRTLSQQATTMGKGKKRRGTIAQADWSLDYDSDQRNEDIKNFSSGSRQEVQSEVSRSSPIPEPQSHIIQTPGVLKNQDILSLIFQHFDLQPGSQTVAQTREDLFSAAKTCKAFVEPALDSLWRVLPSLLPLLLLLPSAEVKNGRYFVDELPLNDDSNSHQFSGWGRLDVHARRVRTIYMEPLRIVISPNIYLRIRAMRDSPLLPGLKNLYIPDNSSFDLSSALFLASGSTLNMVQLGGDAISEREFYVPFLSSLYIKSPGLSHLALREPILCASVEPIYHFTKLQSLEIWLGGAYLHPHLLHKLGQLPHLLDLIISTEDIEISIQPHTNPISISNSNFRQLRHLQLFGFPASISCILSELKGLTNLNTLEIHDVSDGRTGTANSAWKSSFEVISTFSAVEDIKIFHVQDRPKRTHYIHSAHSLAPLFRLDNLKSFIIDFNMGFSGSDDDFRLIAGGFPKLKKFVIPKPSPFLGGFGGVRTLACLYYLSRGCPDLREIKIALSFDSNISDNLNAIKDLPRPIVRNHHHPLKKLYIDTNFGQLKPIQLVQVARFLDHIFPNLSTLETNNKKTTEAANWTGIHELRLALQDARINSSSASGF